MPFNVGVGVSQKWTPKEIAKEVAEGALRHLGGKANFALVFTTFQYNKKIRKILHELQKEFGESTKIVGGTVTAFICKEGCFTRGVVALVGQDSNAIFRNCFSPGLRGNPIKTAQVAMNQLNKNVCEKKNKVLFTVIAGPLNPPLLSNKIVQTIITLVPNQIVNKMHEGLFEISEKLGYGASWEEIVLKEIELQSPTHKIAGISTFDDTSDTNHCIFSGEKVSTDGMSILEFCFDNDYEIIRESPNIIPSGKQFKIKRGWRNICFTEANGIPATTYYLNELMHWPEEWKMPTVGGVFSRTFYFPMGYTKDKVKYAFPMGLFFGESCTTNQIIKSDELELFYTSHTKFLETLKKNLEKIGNKEKIFSIFIEVGTLPAALGFKMYAVKNIIEEKLGDTPYLSLFGCGEHSKTKKEKAIFNNYGRVVFTIFEE